MRSSGTALSVGFMVLSLGIGCTDKPTTQTTREKGSETKVYDVYGDPYQSGDLRTKDGDVVEARDFYDKKGVPKWPGKRFDDDGNEVSTEYLGTSSKQASLSGQNLSDLFDPYGAPVFPQDLFDKNGDPLFKDAKIKISPNLNVSLSEPESREIEGDSLPVRMFCSRVGQSTVGSTLLEADQIHLLFYPLQASEEGKDKEVDSDPATDHLPDDVKEKLKDLEGRNSLDGDDFALSEPIKVELSDQGKALKEKVMAEKRMVADVSSLPDGDYLLLACANSSCTITQRQFEEYIEDPGDGLKRGAKGIIAAVSPITVTAGKASDIGQGFVLMPRRDADVNAANQRMKSVITKNSTQNSKSTISALYLSYSTKGEFRLVAEPLFDASAVGSDGQTEGAAKGPSGDYDADANGPKGDKLGDGKGEGKDDVDGDANGEDNKEDGKDDVAEGGEGKDDGDEAGEGDKDYECDEVSSPLVLNLAGKHFTFSSPYEGVHFDIDADGKKERISWLDGDHSALLALDLDQNGTIDGGHELFGNYSQTTQSRQPEHGFMALRAYDANQDQKIDAKDPIWQALTLWFDQNRDGVSQFYELQPLTHSGLQAIHVNYENKNLKDRYHNEIKQVGFATKAHEKSLIPVVDVWFRVLPETMVATQK